MDEIGTLTFIKEMGPNGVMMVIIIGEDISVKVRHRNADIITPKPNF